MAELSRDSRARARMIRAAIRQEEQRLRARFRWLAYQDFLGLLCFVAGVAVFAGIALLYLRGKLSGWLTVPLLAMPLSLLHELEHDLIHDQYFRRRRWFQNALYTVIWFLKLGLNPWYRRGIHLRHHRFSGQQVDIEERLIGLGVPFGFLRIFLAVHPFGSLFLFERIKRESPDFQPLKLFLLSLPTYGPLVALTYAGAAYAVQMLWLGQASLVFPEWLWGLAWSLCVLLLLPNTLRQFCLILMSSYSHYYEDIPNEVYYQNQILRAWYLWPFQVFCCNFGATHIIHHYVISQPFYLRQMVARAAHQELIRNGVRVDDVGIVGRANRWSNQESGIRGQESGVSQESEISG
jgi:fatty acid desaturase